MWVSGVLAGFTRGGKRVVSMVPGGAILGKVEYKRGGTT